MWRLKDARGQGRQEKSVGISRRVPQFPANKTSFLDHEIPKGTEDTENSLNASFSITTSPHLPLSVSYSSIVKNF
jgi:hypothetical protein